MPEGYGIHRKAYTRSAFDSIMPEGMTSFTARFGVSTRISVSIIPTLDLILC
jgi:hypothetical protein